MNNSVITQDWVRKLIERHSNELGGNGREFHNGAYRKMADEIESEVERNYMRLPEIADGLVRFGDYLECPSARFGPVDAIVYGIEGDVCVYTGGGSWGLDGNETHYHATTIEDVLREFAVEYQRDDESIGDTSYAVERCIEKLREVIADEWQEHVEEESQNFSQEFEFFIDVFSKATEMLNDKEASK